jgi:hypothetical protein
MALRGTLLLWVESSLDLLLWLLVKKPAPQMLLSWRQMVLLWSQYRRLGMVPRQVWQRNRCGGYQKLTAEVQLSASATVRVG